MTCGCGCDGGGAPLAANPANSAGLSQIAYRVGDFNAFRRALLSPLAGEQQLTGWAPAQGDLGLQVLEWWAYLADILTFYNERIANSNYLRTAAAQPGPQGSAAALARLLGYLPTPAITATGFIAAIRTAGVPDGNLKIPAGLQITSTPTADAPAQLFETGDSNSFTGLSDVVVGLKADASLFRLVTDDATTSADRKSVLLGGRVAIPPGEQFVLVNSGWDGTAPQLWAVVTADSATTEKDPSGASNTRLTLESTGWNDLATPADPQASDYKLQRATATALLWTMATSGTSKPAGSAGSSSQTLTVPLATLVRNTSPGDNVLFTYSTGGSSPPTQILAHVTGYAEEVAQVPATNTSDNAAAQDVYIPRTNLTIAVAGTNKDVSGFQSLLNTTSGAGGITMHYGFRDVGELIATPAAKLGVDLKDPVTIPAELTLRGGPGFPVALEDANGAGLIATAPAGATGSVTLQPLNGPPDKPLNAPIRLLANLVEVSQGTTVQSEILGDGDPTAASQAFVLQHSPLIYLPPKVPNGNPVSTLSVSVNGVPWTRVTAFSGLASDATVYVTSALADGSIQVRFGDGINGARLPLGTGNVTATYRYGPPPPAPGSPPPAPGSQPPAPSARRLSTVLQPQPNLAAVRNPVAMVPGTYPESPTQTADAAPATVVLLSAPSAAAPLISLSDCEQLAATVGGVTRVRAYWTWDTERHCPAITVFVGTDPNTDAATAVKAVRERFQMSASRVPLIATRARSRDLTVSCQLLRTQGTTENVVRQAAKAALICSGGLFSPRSMGIGQRLYRSQVEAALMVSGVVAVFGLRVHRSAPGGGPAPSGPGERVLDPGQDGYFSLQESNLHVSVVTR